MQRTVCPRTRWHMYCPLLANLPSSLIDKYLKKKTLNIKNPANWKSPKARKPSEEEANCLPEGMKGQEWVPRTSIFFLYLIYNGKTLENPVFLTANRHKQAKTLKSTLSLQTRVWEKDEFPKTEENSFIFINFSYNISLSHPLPYPSSTKSSPSPYLPIVCQDFSWKDTAYPPTTPRQEAHNRPK